MESLKHHSFGKDLASDLKDSLEAESPTPPELHVEQHRLPALALALSALASRVSSTERDLSALLVAALAACPDGSHGTAMSSFQAAAVLAKPAQADLLQITLFPETLHV